MHAGGRLLRHTAPIFHDLVPAIGILALNFEQQILDDLLFLVCRFRLRPIAAFFQFVAFVNEVFDLRPALIIKTLDLLKPIYAATSVYGHFGREEPNFTWEKTDKAADLKKAAK